MSVPAFFMVFGALSDKIGRKPIILAGCLIAAVTFFPMFQVLATNANPALGRPSRRSRSRWSPIPATAATCSTRSGPACSPSPATSARAYLAQQSVKNFDRRGAGRLGR